MLTVTQRRQVDATPETVWNHLTDAALISEWFGDCASFAPHAPFRFDFGDGDYFVGRVTAWQPPRFLALSWKFMGLANESEIEFDLRPESGGTLVVVQDRGALTQLEADGLLEGWDDFLMRLEKRIGTGQPARYRWTSAVGLGAIARLPPLEVGTRLAQAAWWQALFPGVALDFEARSPERIRVTVTDPAWGGLTTTATVALRPFGEGSFVSVSQIGFDALPENMQVDERRRYAETWERALHAVEAWPRALEP